MLSGTGSIHLDDAFAHQKGIQHICARHEAAAAMMAEASAKLTGDIAVVVATTGPGGTNAMVALLKLGLILFPYWSYLDRFLIRYHQELDLLVSRDLI